MTPVAMLHPDSLSLTICCECDHLQKSIQQYTQNELSQNLVLQMFNSIDCFGQTWLVIYDMREESQAASVVMMAYNDTLGIKLGFNLSQFNAFSIFTIAKNENENENKTNVNHN